MSDILTLHGLTKFFGSVQALHNISFSVPQGSIFGVLGPNGSGKTTTLGILLDVLKANSGNYEWFGKPGNEWSRRKIGALLETPNFYHYLSAADNLKITQAISGRGNNEDINRVLETVNLLQHSRKKFSKYSLGMKQRLAIAAALLGNPDVLVLDEPTNGLDPVGIAEIRGLISHLAKQGTTIIMASHLLDEVEKVCTHVAILKKGHLITAGPVQEVLSNEDIAVVAAKDLHHLQQLMAQYPGVSAIQTTGNTIELFFPAGTASPEAINQYCFEKGVILHQLGMKRKSLEAKFFELTSD